RGYHAQAYVDDLCIVTTGRFLGPLLELMQGAVNESSKWCTDKDLSVNPEKMELVVFTRKRKLDNVKWPSLQGVTLNPTQEVKYLGVTWTNHVNKTCQKATASLWMCRRLWGPNWGLKPLVAFWAYTTVVRP